MDDFFKPQADVSGTKGLVYIGNKILIYKRDNKTTHFPLHIDLPGGGTELLETPFETFKREVHEEFGLEIKNYNVIYAKAYPDTQNEGSVTYFPVVKLPQDEEKNIKFGSEGIEYYLVTVEDFLSNNEIWVNFKQRTRDYLKSIN